MWPSIVIVRPARVGVLAINIGNAALFTTLCSVCIVMLYLAYLLVTVPLLINRLRGDWDRAGKTMPAGLFSLGRWGLPVNILAVLYGAVMVVNLAWPRPEVYDPTGENGLLLFSAPLDGGHRAAPGHLGAERQDAPTSHRCRLTPTPDTDQPPRRND